MNFITEKEYCNGEYTEKDCVYIETLNELRDYALKGTGVVEIDFTGDPSAPDLVFYPTIRYKE